MSARLKDHEVPLMVGVTVNRFGMLQAGETDRTKRQRRKELAFAVLYSAPVGSYPSGDALIWLPLDLVDAAALHDPATKTI